MGSVFSCLASTFIYLGEFLENVFLALGEIGAVLVRGVFGIIVNLCDLLAAVSCCYRVPWSERPDRSFFSYSTNTAAVVTNQSALASVGGKQVLSSVLTKEGRQLRKQIKAARKKEVALKQEQDAAAKSAQSADEQSKNGAKPDQEEATVTTKA
ncbi:hypothetical protein PSEUBRA_002669 [Kalmanozyma brasiliensis GHG001]|uniref:Uncharacterized protein n=1 Tax=Kalmanozyma brasiliensis (strain GHG001) TaxID=1365824 RepID=V5EW88_KALBG|nr:uncharacterized protein PSEUBRA_002669 [Kalmanozyma brasiliensis GHG001]EST07583.1 hypothetical protein PSEUBRA_002669 [Kalmanozyma brasiliensis GHG001]